MVKAAGAVWMFSVSAAVEAVGHGVLTAQLVDLARHQPARVVRELPHGSVGIDDSRQIRARVVEPRDAADGVGDERDPVAAVREAGAEAHRVGDAYEVALAVVLVPRLVAVAVANGLHP